MLFTTVATIAGVSVLTKGYWNTFRPELNIIDLKLQPPTPLEKQLSILHISDIHVERLSVKPERVIEMVGNETFDFIALTGDYVEKVESIERFIFFLRTLTRIPTKYGIYAVWGNHDWVLGTKLSRLKREMEKLGVIVLANENTRLMVGGTPFDIIGIDDHYSYHSNIAKSFAGVARDSIKLILTHDPLIVNALPHSFDYLLCGHSHSGQICYPIPLHAIKMGLKPFKKYISGMQQHPNGPYYINAGLGQTGPNLRLGCKPEITIHRLSS